MKASIHRIVSVIALAVVASGCVSTKNQTTLTSPNLQIQSESDIVPVKQVSTTSTVKSQVKNQITISPQNSKDVWERIRLQMEFSPSNDCRVERRINWYLKHPNYMHTISERAEPFLHYVVEEVEKRQLPIELALIPLIESDFNLKAYSHKHASGLWQLTPYIAKHFGVKINDWYDGRQDIVDSTQAALDFLEYLHKRFDGNWYHAIAAYNTGEGRVFKAIARNQKINKPTDFFHLKLPKETRHFVPKLLAVAQLLKQEKMEFPPIENISKIEVVPLAQQAIIPNTSPWKEMKSLNPGYRRFPALIDGSEHIVLPQGKEQTWNAMLSDLPDLSADTWQQYQIRSGDTLGGIAQRYDLKVSQLKTFNQLQHDNIRAGQTLYLPILADKKIQYTVKSGDSLWRIAKQFDISIEKLKQWNQLASDKLRVGYTLKIFLSQT